MTRKQVTADDIVRRARTALILDHPFFGALALRLTLVESTERPTAWTDGKILGYNPDFIATLPFAEVVGVMAHEVMHCACGHPWRRDGREPQKANVAMDYAINWEIEQCGLKLQAGRLREAAYDGKSFEWIYNRLPDARQRKGGGMPGGGMPGAGGEDVVDAVTGAAGAEGATEADWQQAVQQAAAAAKMRGDLPASLDRFAKAAVEPRIDWKSVLRRFVQQAAKNDYNWTRPSARYLARGLYLPSLRSEAMGPIAVAVDTSGSIDQVTLDAFAAEINAVASEAQPERVVVLYCDARVHRTDVFERDEPVEMHPCGGGGTSHRPVMDAVDAMPEPPVCLICLTDLMTEHRAQPPEMPVLWATTSMAWADRVPYGEVVSLERV